MVTAKDIIEAVTFQWSHSDYPYLRIAFSFHHSQTVTIMKVPDLDCAVSASCDQSSQGVVKRHGCQINHLQVHGAWYMELCHIGYVGHSSV